MKKQLFSIFLAFLFLLVTIETANIDIHLSCDAYGNLS